MQGAIKIIDSTVGRFAVGVSGGADSMCLLSLIIKAGRGCDATVLHIDHAIRTTSARDRRLVEDFCRQNNIEFKAFCIDVLACAKKNKRSIETEARLMRHSVFLDYCSAKNVPLMLAHNHDDNAETILMHIFRGCGIGGLVGMSERDNHIIRPLINVKKSDIYAYVKSNLIPYVEDETNADTSYRRNHIRAILPLVESSFSGAKDSLIALSKIAQKTQKYIEGQLDLGLYSRDSNAVLLDKSALISPIAYQYVINAIKMVGLNADFEQKHVDLVIGLGELPNGKSLDLPHNLRVYNEYSHLAFEFFTPRPMQESDFVLGKNVLGGHVLEVTEAKPQIENGRIIVDADKIKGAKLRTRREGDRFHPCGSSSKKLKEYLNEKKIPLRKRDGLPLLAIEGEVLVVADLQLSDRVKITSETKRAYEIRIF